MSEERCGTTDLLPDQCACPKHRGGDDPNAAPGLLIERFRYAKFATRCRVNSSHTIEPGTYIGLIVCDNDTGRPPFDEVGWACEHCTTVIKDGP